MKVTSSDGALVFVPAAVIAVTTVISVMAVTAAITFTQHTLCVSFSQDARWPWPCVCSCCVARLSGTIKDDRMFLSHLSLSASAFRFLSSPLISLAVELVLLILSYVSVVSVSPFVPILRRGSTMTSTSILWLCRVCLPFCSDVAP